MSKYDVLIIGGGVTGTSIARELSRYKLEIAILEKEEELAFGVSKSNSGIIHPGTQNPPSSLKGKLCVQGNLLTRKIAKELGVDFKEVGELIVIFKEEDMPRLLEIKKEAEALGIPKLKIVDKKWLAKHEPNLNKDIIAALYAPSAGIKKEFGNLPRFHIGAVSDNKDPNQIFESRFVINAAGLYADEISAMVGINDFKITPRKGEEYLLDKKLAKLTNHLIFPLPSPTSNGILVIKTSDGNPMIGPTAEDQIDKQDKSTTEAGMKKVLENVQRIVPKISKDNIIAYFAGLRPVSGKDFIIRHEDKVPGFISVAGIQSPGLTAAPAIALLVVKLLKQNGLALKKKILFFHKHRKPTVHLFAMPVEKAKALTKKDPAYGDIVCRCEMVSAKEIRDAIKRGAKTLDGIKFRTRCQSGRCHGGFCTTRAMKILAEELAMPLTEVTKRGKGSEIIKESRKQ
ncbi:MAG: NAD(P)/FAD-dependent oxidoreductase [Candidatus Saganbacteria bacterium]|nr:NAD(P)/FAD-dependent oxidoreductase [Candidatus Saganbacteria bacterium]